MTDHGPKFADNYDGIGRLYHKPDTKIPASASDETIKKLIENGDLMPSITNVISVRNAPHLLSWAAYVVAKEAIETEKKWPGRLKGKPLQAIEYLKNTPIRERDFWGAQGTKIHNACENIVKGLPVDYAELTQYEKGSIKAWEQWVKEFKPEFLAVEATGFGKNLNGKNYAGTSDFIAKINNKNFIGDYKCVTDDTKILMADGTQKRAIDLKAGESVVAWSEKEGLTSSQVSFVGDNGNQKIVSITTEDGQNLECTDNHPVWLSRNNGKASWVEASKVQAGDIVYLGYGWDIHHQKERSPWAYRKGLSPYSLGLFWALYNLQPNGFELDTRIKPPRISDEGFYLEVKDLGAHIYKDGTVKMRNAIEKASRKSGLSVDEIMELLKGSVPEMVSKFDASSAEAFFCGIQEVFSNRKIDPNYYYVVFKDVEKLRDLQQRYLNSGIKAELLTDVNQKTRYLKVSHPTLSYIYTHGLKPVKVSHVMNIAPKHTVAIEVSGTHTHFTNGILTHNTNRSGLHVDIALQLAANSRVDFIIDEDGNTLELPPLDGALGIHISPKGVTTKRIDISDDTFYAFSALRDAWEFHTFEGKLNSKKGVFLENIKDPTKL